MSDTMIERPSPVPLPAPRVPVTVRAGTLADVPFIDRLQKLHGRAVGWMPTTALEGKINAGHVLVAVGRVSDPPPTGSRGAEGSSPADGRGGSETRPTGYVIGNDRYFKRDDVGIVYQMNVDPAAQRGLVGATLLGALFDRAAYGCRLYSCWCAQDLAANRFWEAMGFVPLAFRAGSAARDRTHVFWQKRIRAGDTGDPSRGGTPWWFPAKTDGGAMREDRLVLPIPRGVRWDDAMPRLLPADECRPDASGVPQRAERSRSRSGPVVGSVPHVGVPKCGTKTPRGRVQFGPPEMTPVVAAVIVGPVPPPAVPVVARPAKAKVRCDPKLIAAARELRDRWLEHVNEVPARASGKYDVTRAIAERVTVAVASPRLIAAA